ncbi:MAG TPA: prepilin-type cleavage/methylation domain-containing protein, partial [Candidatus Methylomirabilis sp.]|nr:prepilin-type cleavage/methylation domain-containing protein [Candidatus Methylomirabilis sp.]
MGPAGRGGRANASGSRASLGFTLIELLLLVAVLGLLVTFGIPEFARYQDRARNTRAAADITMLQFDIRAYASANNGQFPPTLDTLGRGAMRDPWGNTYRYLVIATAIPGHVRKDRFLVPLNSDYDLYSMG